MLREDRGGELIWKHCQLQKRSRSEQIEAKAQGESWTALIYGSYDLLVPEESPLILTLLTDSAFDTDNSLLLTHSPTDYSISWEPSGLQRDERLKYPPEIDGF